jgi:hypothetical protein
MRNLACLIAAGVVASAAPALAHIAEVTVALTTAEETPPPQSVSPAAGGTAILELEDDMTINYEVTVHDLTGPATVAHIHDGAPGVPGPFIFPLTKVSDTSFMGTTPPLTADQVGKFFSGGYYVNVHTTTNPAGEVRGQIVNVELNKGTCSCQTLSRKNFRKCVNDEIKKLDKTQKKSADVRALRKAVKRSACGLAAAPKKKPAACCLPVNEVANIVTGELCAPVKKDIQCTKLGGMFVASSSCVPNPCSPPASPSGAFVD